jgi:membrane-associated HD superfamily phosphohydrolase
MPMPPSAAGCPLGAVSVVQVCLILASLSSALLGGGILALGAFSAPALFQTLSRADAGRAMTQIFRRFDRIVLGAALVQLTAYAGIVAFKSGQVSTVVWLQLMVSVLSALLAGVLVKTVNPKLEQLQIQCSDPAVSGSEAIEAEFSKLHQSSEKLYKLLSLLAFSLLVLNPLACWR